MKWIAEFPSTNGKIVVGLALSSMYVTAALVADILRRPLGEATHIAVGTFLFGLMSLGAYQYKVKRETHIEPPAKPDIEDAPALKQEPDAAHSERGDES